MNIDKFPNVKHFAIIVFNDNIGHDGSGWYTGENAVNYFVMSEEEAVTWIETKSEYKRYKIIEATPVDIEMTRPVLKVRHDA